MEEIEASITAPLVDESWRDWDGDAEAAIALRIDGADSRPRVLAADENWGEREIASE